MVNRFDRVINAHLAYVNVIYFIEYHNMGLIKEVTSRYAGDVKELENQDADFIDMSKFSVIGKDFLRIVYTNSLESFRGLRENWLNEPFPIMSTKYAPFDPFFKSLKKKIVKTIFGEKSYGILSRF